MNTYRWQQKIYTRIRKQEGWLPQEEAREYVGRRRDYDMIKVGYFQGSSFCLVGSWLLINII